MPGSVPMAMTLVPLRCAATASCASGKAAFSRHGRNVVAGDVFGGARAIENGGEVAFARAWQLAFD